MTVDLYEILEIESSASSGDVKKAYRKLALRYHPDKVTEEEREEAEIRFKEISHAYEVLSDEAKRLDYDLYGSADGPGAGMGDYDSNPFGNGYGAHDYNGDDFYNFFNNMNGGPRAAPRKQRTADANMEVDVTLEDLFRGKTVKITATRNIICPGCKGTGAKKKAVARKCSACEGEGYQIKIKRVGPGLVAQQRVECDTCHGKGEAFRSKDNCKHCRGKFTVEETKILEFEIAPGTEDGESVVLQRESDQYPGKETGDVILTVHCKKHEVFTRKEKDLFVKYKITLVEALSGFSKVLVKHLDGRGLHVATPKGKVVRPGDYIKMKGEGMPDKSAGSSWFGFGPKRGDLYVKLDIEFPPDNWYLEKNDIVKLKNLLPTELSNKNDERRQNIPEESLPEPNIEYVTDFTIAREETLPSYKEDATNESFYR